MKKCKFCWGEVQDKMLKCRHCWEFLPKIEKLSIINKFLPFIFPLKNRSDRWEFLSWLIFWWTALYVISIFISLNTNYEIIAILMEIISLIVLIKFIINRFHDYWESWWNILWWIVPLISPILLLVLLIKSGEDKVNEYW